ncbi:FCD domain-containing protein [Acinetobacter baumannii]|uniref:GntR family transcriptional regulator n=1 Tax=Acinetobacter baumannii TaxID=470 RepID=UPI0023416BD8|nr:FCD domain-containing protein [Acinetobacter baumannii]MDC5522334.1 FCD domain-containing protein [Acinetobacter baumannii]MDO7417696.1 FCD domain-containing protein [Acinetobacter baumannii]MDV4217021.1 FCD domain-containing protein [Acinetobacter baumannii]HCA5042784.1 FCD domain-containing protein [Acinetobacter baumannii]
MNFEKNLSQTENVYLCIREAIISGSLAPGMKIKINELCKKNNASLGAVREALSRLTAEGLVQSEAQKGFTITPISIEDLKNLATTRIEIESLCLEHSINSGDLDWESNILAAYHRLKMTPERKADQPDTTSNEWENAHQKFHYLLVSACKNSWLLKMREFLYAQGERYRRLSTHYDQDHRNLNEEHEELMHAVLTKNIPLAKELMKNHILKTTEITSKAMNKN